MLYEKLVKYCIQYLEQSSDVDVMNTDINEIADNDTFSEYIYNIEHSIYMGLSRYAQSLVLPVMEKEITSQSFYLTTDNTISGKRVFHKIKEIYALDKDGNFITNIDFIVVGSKIVIKKFDEDLTYYVIYHPTVLTLDNYLTDIMTIYDIDLNNIDGNGLCVPDEMAINLKFLVYSELKVEDNPSVANLNKNYFESYLEECKINDTQNNENEAILTEMGDIYGN